jgi:hypothetical protein
MAFRIYCQPYILATAKRTAAQTRILCQRTLRGRWRPRVPGTIRREIRRRLGASISRTARLMSLCERVASVPMIFVIRMARLRFLTGVMVIRLSIRPGQPCLHVAIIAWGNLRELFYERHHCPDLGI